MALTKSAMRLRDWVKLSWSDRQFDTVVPLGEGRFIRRDSIIAVEPVRTKRATFVYDEIKITTLAGAFLCDGRLGIDNIEYAVEIANALWGATDHATDF